MDKLIIPESALPYVKELRKLIRTGVTAAPSLNSSILVDLPAVTLLCGKQASKDVRAYAFISTLERVISERLSGKDTETARILFGYGEWAGMPQQDRYRAVAKLFNAHWTWENYRKEPLSRHLLAVYYALVRDTAASSLAAQEPHLARTGLIGQEWIMDRCECKHIFPSQIGEPIIAIHDRTLRCVVKEANTWRYRLRWRKRGTEERPEIILLGEGTIKYIEDFSIDSTGTRMVVYDIMLPKTLKYGETATFSIIVKLPVDYNRIAKDNPTDWYGLSPLPAPVATAKIGLHFAPDMLPKSLWVHEDIVDGLTRPTPPGKLKMLHLSADNYVEYTWKNLTTGYSCGISLEW